MNDNYIHVGPHGLEWNVGLAVIVDDFRDVVDVLVAISALVELFIPTSRGFQISN